MATRLPKFEIYRSRSAFKGKGGWRWRLVSAGNSKKLAASGEAFRQKIDCRTSIDIICRECMVAEIVEL